MNSADSSIIAPSLGDFVRRAVEVRQRWLEKHAKEDSERKGQWEEIKRVLEAPGFVGHD